MQKRIKDMWKNAVEKIHAAKTSALSRPGANNTKQFRNDVRDSVAAFFVIVAGGFVGGMVAGIILRLTM